jgi:hypothetical protein
MGIYIEKRDQLIEKVKVLEKRIASDTAKKKSLEEKLKEITRLAMAEEYNCKPRELDEIINAEHSLLQKLRASGLSDSELLEIVGVPVDNKVKDADSKNAYSESADSSDSDSAEDSTDDGDEITFYGKPVTDYD